MTLRERFESKYEPVPEAGCWLWTASLQGSYGQIGADGGGGILLAHRVSYELYVGPIPHGMQVCHRCDIPICVNPSHLFIGTQRDNVLDMFKKGRGIMQTHPEVHHNRKKTVCKYGHEFTPENTEIRKNGSRLCVACKPRLNRLFRKNRNGKK